MPERVKVTGGMYRGKVPPGAVYVGRAMPGLKQSPFANPWCVRQAVHSLDGTFDGWVVSHHRNRGLTVGPVMATKAEAVAFAVEAFRTRVAVSADLRQRAVAELAGKDLACWCKPGEPCHADVLLAIANAVRGGES